MLNLQSLRTTPIELPVKGLPSASIGLSIKGIAAQNWNVLGGDLPFPLLVLRETALLGNIKWLQRLADDHAVSLAPHGKTTMAPQIFDLQLEAGAWGITVANTHQAAIAAHFGVPRILVANTVASQADIATLAGLHGCRSIVCFTDSVNHVELLADVLAGIKPPRPMPLVIELGIAGKRTGCRSLQEIAAVTLAIGKYPDLLAVAGVAGYEGLIGSGEGDGEAARVEAYLRDLLDAADIVATAKLHNDECLITVGGSAFIDLVLEFMAGHRPAYKHRFILRSGCSVTHDNGLYGEFYAAMRERKPEWQKSGPQAALELWSIVQSRPEPESVILSFGKRDCPYDAGLPVPLVTFPAARAGCAGLSADGKKTRPAKAFVTELRPLDTETHALEILYDQHARMKCPPDSPLAVGDLVCCGISHPCGAFDRWQYIVTANDDYAVTGAIRTFF